MEGQQRTVTLSFVTEVIHTLREMIALWEITILLEKWMTRGHVRVVPPNSQSNKVTGDALQYQFTIQNYQTSDDTFNLTLSSSNGWSTNLPGGSRVAVSATSSQTVTAEVT